jgi:hypothetical protein
MANRARTGANEPEIYHDTLPPKAISAELAPAIDALGLRENCRQLAIDDAKR